MSASLDDSRRPVVVLVRRTAFGRAGGMFRGIEAHDLLAPVLASAVSGTGHAGLIDDVIIGNAVGGGGNVARLAALTAGLPLRVPGITLDRQCASGLDAVILACRLIASGAGSWYLAGGVESCSTSPLRAHWSSSRVAPDFYARARFAPDVLGDPDAGEAAENVARAYGIGRARQDAYALQSHRRALAAGLHDVVDEIVPLGTAGSHRLDQNPRRSVDAQLLARFRPVFAKDGTVTAGNSCADADGAVVAVVTSLACARTAGASGLLEFLDSAVVGGDPTVFGVAGAYAVNAVRSRLGLGVAGVAFWEFNEAFAAQVLASADLMGVPSDRLNQDGGALAFGHPYGASGAMLVAHLFRRARREGDHGAVAIAGVSAAGGLGTAAAFRWLSRR